MDPLEEEVSAEPGEEIADEVAPQIPARPDPLREKPPEDLGAAIEHTRSLLDSPELEEEVMRELVEKLYAPTHSPAAASTSRGRIANFGSAFAAGILAGLDPEAYSRIVVPQMEMAARREAALSTAYERGEAKRNASLQTLMSMLERRRHSREMEQVAQERLEGQEETRNLAKEVQEFKEGVQKKEDRAESLKAEELQGIGKAILEGGGEENNSAIELSKQLGAVGGPGALALQRRILGAVSAFGHFKDALAENFEGASEGALRQLVGGRDDLQDAIDAATDFLGRKQLQDESIAGRGKSGRESATGLRIRDKRSTEITHGLGAVMKVQKLIDSLNSLVKAKKVVGVPLLPGIMNSEIVKNFLADPEVLTFFADLQGEESLIRRDIAGLNVTLIETLLNKFKFAEVGQAPHIIMNSLESIQSGAFNDIREKIEQIYFMGLGDDPQFQKTIAVIDFQFEKASLTVRHKVSLPPGVPLGTLYVGDMPDGGKHIRIPSDTIIGNYEDRIWYPD